jgi:hypothetical protein
MLNKVATQAFGSHNPNDSTRFPFVPKKHQSKTARGPRRNTRTRCLVERNNPLEMAMQVWFRE